MVVLLMWRILDCGRQADTADGAILLFQFLIY